MMIPDCMIGPSEPCEGFKDLGRITDSLRAKLAEAYKENEEQARLLGMSAEREARLAATLVEAERERDELRAARMAYAKEFALNEEGEPDVGSVHANIRVLKIRAERLEAAIRDALHTLESYRIWGGQEWSWESARHPLHAKRAHDKLRAALEKPE